MSYGVPNVTGQGGYGGGGGILGFLTQGLKGYEDAHKLKTDERQQKIENKQTADTAAEQKTMDTATIQNMNLENVAAAATAKRLDKQDATTDATTRVDNVTNQAIKFPELAKDPVMMNQYITDMNTLGRPVVRNKDGSVNWDAMNPKQMSDMSVDDFAKYMAMDPITRKNATQGYGGRSKSFLTDPAVYTPEAQAKLTTAGATSTRATTAQTHQRNVDRMNDTKLGFTERLTAAKTAYTEAQTGTVRALALARINELTAQAGKANAEAAAVGPRLQIQMEGLGLRAGQLRVAQDRLRHDTSKDAFTQLHGATVALDDYAGRTQSELTAAQTALTAYKTTKYSGGEIPPDDAMGQSLQQNYSRLDNTLYTARQQADSARSAFVNYTHQGRAMTSQGGGRQSTIMPRRGAASGGTPIGSTPAGTADGTKTTYQGKTLTARGGKWYE